MFRGLKSKGNSFHSLHSDSAVDSSRPQSGYRYDPPSPSTEGSYNPYKHHHSTSSISSPRQQILATQPHLQAPDTVYSSDIGGQPYDRQTYHTAEYQEESRQQLPRKSVRSKIKEAATKARAEPSTQSKGLFTRRKSVGRGSTPTAIKQEPPLYTTNSTQWQPEPPQLLHATGHEQRFEPLSPDFTLEEPTPDAPLHLDPPSYPELGPYHSEPHSRNQGQHHVQQQAFPHEGAPSSAGSTNSPNRPSFDSLQRPASRPDTHSRPTSRASHERYLVEAHRAHQQLPHSYNLSSRPLPEPHEARLQSQGRHNETPYRPYSVQVQQQVMSPPENGKLSTPGLGERGSSLQPGSTSHGGPISPNVAMGSSPLSGKERRSSRDGDTTGQRQLLSKAPSDLSEAEVHQLLEAQRRDAHELSDIKKKYNHCKRQYFAQKEQMETLQNTLAQQRLTASRTVWDDGRYQDQLTRLDGLVKEVSYKIRKDWSSMPEWLEDYVNKDALQTKKQEMTAVGRTFISRWLVNELFDKYFHPDLHPEFSRELKALQRNIRVTAPPPRTAEEEETLTSRITAWRLTTVDGLKPTLTLPNAPSNRESFSAALGSQLRADISQYMTQPPPADLDSNIPMIMQLAVDILANLPQESRDVHIGYYDPGHPIDEEVMSIETGIPALSGGAAGPQDIRESTDQASTSETASIRSGERGDETKQSEDSGRKSFLGFAVGGKKKDSGRSSSPTRAPTSIQPTPVASPAMEKEELPPRVRMCIFLELHVRGKNVLMKAPVYKI